MAVNYYRNQLKCVKTDGEYLPVVQITSEGGKTNCMSLNEICASELVNWLTEKYLTKKKTQEEKKYGIVFDGKYLLAISKDIPTKTGDIVELLGVPCEVTAISSPYCKLKVIGRPISYAPLINSCRKIYGYIAFKGSSDIPSVVKLNTPDRLKFGEPTVLVVSYDAPIDHMPEASDEEIKRHAYWIGGLSDFAKDFGREIKPESYMRVVNANTYTGVPTSLVVRADGSIQYIYE
ncbi:MAG: hypothetical protein [Podoviridae sp. ctrTa16]|nr:MAG: hypothetical protein [Podoviridae sp. ctrTa16]